MYSSFRKYKLIILHMDKKNSITLKQRIVQNTENLLSE